MSPRLPLLVSLLLVVVSCTTGSGDATTSTEGSTVPSTQGTTTTTDQEGTTTTTLPDPTWTEIPGIEDLPQEVQDELLALVRRTEDIRRLRFLEAPNVVLVGDAELEARVRSQIEEEADDLPADQALYQLLGLLPPEVDLTTLLLDLYGEQVAGYYDGEAGELVVPIRDDGFTPVQRATLVHELTHALTDQHFGFDPVLREMDDQDRLDQASAYQALIEGDASLVELIYLQGLSQGELGEFFAEALEIDSTALEAAPQFIQDSLFFPYDSGLAWAQAMYREGDWSMIDDAYGTFPDLPASTEQIITPSDYLRDLPVSVDYQAPEIPGYTLERESTWGELGFRIMLDQALGEEVGVEAADGWGGDWYAQWYDGENAALLILYVGDTTRDRSELEEALLDYAFSTVPEPAFVWVEVIGARLTFVAADEPPVGEALLASVRG